MPKIIPKYTFVDQTKAYAIQMNEMFAELIEVINGELDFENLAQNGIGMENLNFQIIMLDPVLNATDLPTTDKDNSIRLVVGEQTFYRMSGGVWSPVVRPIYHNDTLSRDAVDSHPITAITGLRVELDGIHTDVTNHAGLISSLQTSLNALTTRVSDVETNKADKSTTYTKTDVDGLLSNKSDKSSTYSKSETDNLLSSKANTSDVNNALSTKANVGDSYTKAQSDGAYEKKVVRGSVAPSDTTVLWLDTSITPAGLKYYDGTSWTLTGDGVGAVGSGVSINDSSTSSTTETWSANKINTQLGTKEPTISKKTGFNLDVGTTSGTVAQGNHNHSGVYEPVITPKKTAFNVDFGTVSGTAAQGNHTHDGVYEPTIAKKTGFNLDLGTTAGTVSEGNHTHDGVYIKDPATKSSGQYLEFDGTNWVAVNAPSGGSGGSGLPVVSSSLPGTASVDKVEFEKDVNKFIKSVPNTAGATAILPKTFTSSTLNGYTISESSYYTTNPGWKVADGSATTYWTVANANIPAWILFSLPSPKVVCKYSIMGQNAATTPDPRSWKLEGSNDQTNWVLCDNQQDVNTWANAEDKSFNVQNPGSYQYYRITISNYLNMASGTSTMQIAEIQLFEPASYSWVEITDRDVSTLQTKVANMYQMVSSNAIPTPTNIDQILYVKDLNQWQKSIPASGTAYTIATPNMTGNVSGSVITSASDYNTSYEPWKAFDINTTTYWISASTSGAWLQVDFGVGNEKGIVKYATNIGSQTLTRAPKNFRLQGSVSGTTWVDLDTQTGITYTASTDMVFYPKYPGVYRFYRLYVDANGGDTTYTALAELKLWTASTLAWTPIQDPTYVTDFTIKKGVPTIVLDAGRASTSSIQWNANGSSEFGINHKLENVTKFQITSTGINVWDANSAGLKAVRHAGQNYAFRAYTSSATLTVETTTNTYHKLILEQRDYEITSTTAYDTTNGKYVAPAPGVYQLNLKVRGSGMDNGTRWKFMIYKNGVFEATVGAGYYPNGADIDFGGSLAVRLAKNDYVEIYYNVSNSVASSKVIYNGRNETYFDGHLAIPE